MTNRQELRARADEIERLTTRVAKLEAAIEGHRQACAFVPESELMVGRIRPWDEALWSSLGGDA